MDFENVVNIQTAPSGADSILLTWSAPPYAASCDLRYFVTVDAPSDPEYTDSCDDIEELECELNEACEMNINIRTEYEPDRDVYGVTPYPYTCEADIAVIHT